IGNVVYTSGDKRLYTDKLDYDIISKVSYFFEGGRLIDEQNDLTSKIGYYYSRTDLAIFYDSVRLKAETFDLATDTLKYFTIPKVAYTDGPTTIISESGNTIDNTGGKYETVKEKMELVAGKVETVDYYLEGDELFLDDYTQYYKATGNVKLTAKNNDVIITGDEGYYDKASGLSKVYGNPVMKKIMAVDTFYMSADTLVAVESEIDSAKRILGFKDVRIFKENLQGITDSISYFLSDSIIFMYEDPVLWTTKNQISGDTISLLIKEKYVDKMNLYRNSFMVSQDTLGQFNQVKGRNMVAEFNLNDIERIHVLGNCESLYFALSQKEDYLIGMNKVTCSNMIMLFKENELSGLNFYKKPEASMTPPHELSPAAMKLPGFQWRNDERPTLPYVLLRPERIKKADSAPEGTSEDGDTPATLPTGDGNLLENGGAIQVAKEEKQ
ncbi:MAG: OstA-like protein, partial [Bacteroidota bacterium]